MFHLHSAWLFVGICAVGGCATVGSLVSGSGDVETAVAAKPEFPDFDFNIDDTDTRPVYDGKKLVRIISEDEQKALARMEIKATPQGSPVLLYDDSRRRIVGTFVRSDSETVELEDCHCREAVPEPDGGKVMKTTRVPALSVRASSIVEFGRISKKRARELAATASETAR